MRTAVKDSPAKEKLLDAAQALILAKGFVGTTVDDICKAAKLTKGSFFHYFQGKDDLAAKLLARYCTSSKEEFLAGCCPEEKDPLKRVYRFLDGIEEMKKRRTGKGCLVGSMAQELADTHPDIRAVCARAFTEMGGGLKRDLAEAKAKYAPHSDIDPESLAEHFVVVLEGTLLVSRVRPGGAKTDGIAHYRAYLKALFGR